MKFLYRIQKDLAFEAAHQLHGLPTNHPCSKLHGHSYKVQITLVGYHLDEVGFLLDFNVLKRVRDALDHKNLNEVLTVNPTAENISRHIYDILSSILQQLDLLGEVAIEKIRVQETATSFAELEVVPE